MPGQRLALMAIILGIAACGSDAGRNAAKPLAFESVTLGASLAEIRGHHLVGMELYRAGDAAAALAHAGHPIAEVLSVVEGDIRDADAKVAAALRATLDAVAQSIQARKPPKEVSAAIEAATRLVSSAEVLVVGEVQESSTYRGSVVAALLSTAAQEYAEAVHGDKAITTIEYQDAYGFIRVAGQIYAAIKAAVERVGAIEARQIDEAFGRLENALPSPVPAATHVRFEEVQSDAVLIASKIQETVGAVLAPEPKANEVVTRIGQLLDQALAEYQRGSKTAAADLVAEAYLKHYELIEVDVIEFAEHVNAELEPLLSSQLRNRITNGAPVADVRRMIDRAKALLAEALRALER